MTSVMPRVLKIGWLVLALAYLVFYAVTLQPIFTSFLNDAYTLHSEGLAKLGIAPEGYAAYLTGLNVLQIIFTVGIGLLIFWKRSDDPIALMMSLAIISFTVQSGRGGIALATAQPDLWWISTLARVINGIVILLFFALFPNGKLVPYRWAITYLVFGWAFITFPTNDIRNYLTPASTNTTLALSALYILIGLGLQIWRYRNHSSQTEKQQTKWVLYGLVGAVGFLVLNVVISLLFSTAINNDQTARVIYRLFSNTFLVSMPVIFLPVSTTVAILRNRLWDIDLLINRSLVVIITSLGLVTAFLVVIGSSQLVFQDSLGSFPAIITALAAGMAFNPSRHRVQRLIDRRFYRWRFDLDQLAAAEREQSSAKFGEWTGNTLDNYKVVELVGMGGMGEVYKAFKDTRNYAIKTLLKDATPDHLERFKREIAALEHLQHPNIVRFYAAGFDPAPYLVLEYIEGVHLGTYLGERGKFPPRDALLIASGIADALDYAHNRGVIHRDLKPANILIRSSQDGASVTPILVDFGIAKFTDSSSLTGTGAIGTINYMSPEQIEASRRVTYKADIYAFGVILYEMLTGKPPFTGDIGTVLFAHIQQPPPDITQHAPDLPVALNPIFHRVLAKNADERWPTAREFIDALASVLT